MLKQVLHNENFQAFSIFLIILLGVLFSIWSASAKFQTNIEDQRQKDFQDIVEKVEKYHFYLAEVENIATMSADYQIGIASDGCKLNTDFCQIDNDSCYDFNYVATASALTLPADVEKGTAQRTGFAFRAINDQEIIIKNCYGAQPLEETINILNSSEKL